MDIVKPVNIERYTATKVYLFELRGPIMLSCDAYIAGVHWVGTCFS